jgi:FixJ family two-component response regulator
MNDERSRGEIYIVDDEPTILKALSTVLELEGYRVSAFADGGSFLRVARARTPACVLLDVHMPGRSGLDILKELNAEQYAAPIFIISGQGDIPMAVAAIRSGAHDFIEKPFDARTVVAHVNDAITAWTAREAARGGSEIPTDFPGRESLTAREHDVLLQITGGASNKEAGRMLGISPRTVEVHRARILEKLGAKNAADLVRIVMSRR